MFHFIYQDFPLLITNYFRRMSVEIFSNILKMKKNTKCCFDFYTVQSVILFNQNGLINVFKIACSISIHPHQNFKIYILRENGFGFHFMKEVFPGGILTSQKKRMRFSLSCSLSLQDLSHSQHLDNLISTISFNGRTIGRDPIVLP